MFGSFSEEAQTANAEKVNQKRVAPTQGAKWADNDGVGDHDNSFIDNYESQDVA